MTRSLKKPKAWLILGAILLALAAVPPLLGLALSRSAGRGDVAAVDRLLAVGVAPSDEALGEAVLNGRAAVACSLLRAGADPNAMNDLNETTLAYASEGGHAEIVRLMLAAGADPNRGCREMTPLSLAERGKYTEITAMLRAAGARE